MGQLTPNIAIFIPAAGETNYSQSFAAGMMNVDQHDHSGGPNKGVPITNSGLADFSVTYDKLNSNVADPNTGIGPKGGSFQNQLQLLGYIANLYQLSLSPGVGFVSMNGGVSAVRTFQNSSSITWTNANGSGNPTATLATNAINTNQSAFRANASAQPNVTGNSVDYKVQFATTDYNQGSNFVGGATSEYTVPITGRYLVSQFLTLNNTPLSDPNRTRVQIYKNGVFYKDLTDQDTAVNNVGIQVSGTDIYQFTAGDVITLHLFVNNTSSTQIVGITSGSFTITLLTA